jgi:hypothetical protein
MAVYAGAVLRTVLEVPVPALTHADTDHFVLSWDAIEDAISYQFTTDNGASWLPIISDVDVTTDSRGQALVETSYYNVRIRAVGLGGTPYDVSGPSSIVSVYTSAILPPVVVFLTPHPTEDSAIWLLRAYVVEDNDAPVTIEFHYGLTSGYGSVAAVNGEQTTGMAAQKYVRLLPNRTYHLMVRGTNMGGSLDTDDSILQTSDDVRWRVYEGV